MQEVRGLPEHRLYAMCFLQGHDQVRRHWQIQAELHPTTMSAGNDFIFFISTVAWISSK